MTEFSELHDASSKPWIQLSSFTALVFLLLTQNCSGLPQVVGPSQPILATVGGDVVLSCRLEPAVDASGMSIEWSREDLDPSYVYVWWDKEELESSKHPDYKGRTSLLFSELKFGDISLKLSKVKPSDRGKYRCFIPTLGRASTVKLVVDDYFKVQSRNTSTIVGSVVSSAAAFILLIVAVVLFVRTRRQRSKMKTLQRTLKQLKEDNSETNNQLQRKNEILKNHLKELRRKNSEINNQLEEEKLKNEILENQLEELKRNYSEIKNQLQEEKQKNENLNIRLIEFMKTKGSLLDEKLKSMKTERKLKNKIQNQIQELDEMNFDSNFDSTGSNEKNQQEESEKQNWMKTVGNLKTELQEMNQELKLTGSITVEQISIYGFYIRLKNISSEEINLEGWKLELQKNNRESAGYRFNESVKLQAGEILTIWDPNWFILHPDDVNLMWSNMMKWNPEDKLQIKLISNDGETFKML